MLLKILQNLQEHSCARGPKATTLLKRDFGLGAFLWVLRNFYKHNFYRTPPVAASESHIKYPNSLEWFISWKNHFNVSTSGQN